MSTESTKMVSLLLQPTIKFTEKDRQFENQVVRTYFEDWQALSLLSGITNIPKARKIWYKYADGSELSDSELLFAHNIANELKAKYNDDLLGLALCCPPKPFVVLDAKELFDEMDLAKDKVDNPVLRFFSEKADRNLRTYYRTLGVENPEYILINDHKIGTNVIPDRFKFSVSFWVEKKNSKVVKRDTDLLVFRNDTTGKKLAHITRGGEFRPLRDGYIPKPVISLFFRVCSNPRSYVINYGLESGNCSYCDRELTHPNSIKRSYGPKCAEDRGLPW